MKLSLEIDGTTLRVVSDGDVAEAELALTWPYHEPSPPDVVRIGCSWPETDIAVAWLKSIREHLEPADSYMFPLCMQLGAKE